MKTVLIDDERLARAELCRLLVAHPEVEILGEAGNVTEALRILPALRPDLVFLDIEMPERTGFDLLAALTPPHPEILFRDRLRRVRVARPRGQRARLPAQAGEPGAARGGLGARAKPAGRGGGDGGRGGDGAGRG